MDAFLGDCDFVKMELKTSCQARQGFWIYGIASHFNSGIWYFVVKIQE